MVGFEPTNFSFADICLRPLDHMSIFADTGNFEIPTNCLTNSHSSSELHVLFIILQRTRESNPHPITRSPLAGECSKPLSDLFSIFAEEVRLELTRVLPPTVFKTATHRPTWLTLPLFCCIGGIRTPIELTTGLQSADFAHLPSIQ